MGFKKKSHELFSADTLVQDYTDSPWLSDVQIFKQAVFSDDWGGSFKEIIRLEEELPMVLTGHGFIPRQINRSIIAPQTRRFWHVHPNQSEIWAVANGSLNIGLVDIRVGSFTFHKQMKVILDENKSVVIPKGVAHGLYNPSTTKEIVLIYITDRFYQDGEDTEEYRIDPLDLSYDFVLPETL